MLLSNSSPSSNSHRPGEVWNRLQVTEERFLDYISLFTDTIYSSEITQDIFAILSANQFLLHLFQVKCDRQFDHAFQKSKALILQCWIGDIITLCNVTLCQLFKNIVFKVFIRATAPVVFASLVSQTSSIFPDRLCCCPGKLSWKLSWGASVAWGFDIFVGIVGPIAS